ncbi:hypothetical protein SCUCBS95973_006738 [Sporothrix curviconia]|uniref:Uncharacterized protein n=1 Tax=Sporothrix curviconia TaxID=1260050 RepID=A0ABP0C7X9_9PEZI
MTGPQPSQPDASNTTSNRSQADADRPLVEVISQYKSVRTSIGTIEAAELEELENWVYPPEFYDRLSKIHMTDRALEELDRRNILVQHHPERRQSHETVSFLLRTMPNKEGLARFARHGGPDLQAIRNASTLYDIDVEQYLQARNVQAAGDSQIPSNLAEIQAALARRRPSLSSSQFSVGAFRSFRDKSRRARNEDAVMADIMPAILGECAAHAVGKTFANNLTPLNNNGTTTRPKHGIYYGSRPQELSRTVRAALGHRIMPSPVRVKPLAPNFFVKVNGPDRSAAAAARQARFDGALGSCGIHCLQNYGREEPTYDARAYAFSSIYHNGQLQLYAHHLTAPNTGGGQPQYHTTQVGSWKMAGNAGCFRRGATAFRNARDLAKQHRDTFIQAANEAVKEASRAQDLKDTEEAQEEEDGQGPEERKPMKRRQPPPSSAASVRLTRAAVKRLRQTSG